MQYLQAFEVEINGKKQWRWLAVGFEDDTYYDSQTVDLHTYADAFEGLITENNEEDESEEDDFAEIIE